MALLFCCCEELFVLFEGTSCSAATTTENDAGTDEMRHP